MSSGGKDFSEEFTQLGRWNRGGVVSSHEDNAPESRYAGLLIRMGKMTSWIGLASIEAVEQHISFVALLPGGRWYSVNEWCFSGDESPRSGCKLNPIVASKTKISSSRTFSLCKWGQQ